MLERSGERVYREDFKFQFQGGGGNVSWLKNGRRQRTINEIDLFITILTKSATLEFITLLQSSLNRPDSSIKKVKLSHSSNFAHKVFETGF